MLRSVILTIALLVSIAPARADVTHIDNVMLEQLLRSGVPVVDVRTPEEWSKTGVIQGAHLLTFFDAEGRYDVRAWLAQLATVVGPDEPLALICHSGGRSSAVARLLNDEFGYRQVYNVREGMAQWDAENRATVDRP